MHTCTPRKAVHVNTFAQAAQLYLPYHQIPGNVAQTSSSRHFISLIWRSSTSSVSSLGQQPTLITLSWEGVAMRCVILVLGGSVSSVREEEESER